MKYILYATDKNGFVHRVGIYDSLYDIKIRVSMFNDVVLTIEEELDEKPT